MRHPGKYIFAILLLALFTVLSVQSLYETGQNSFWDPVEMEDETFHAKFFSKELEEEALSEACKALQRQVAGEIQYFPVPDSALDPKLTTSYVNTWMAERSYGGKRGHEGIDIMADVQRPGLYPVVSMTDGVVTNLGWLEQGGYLRTSWERRPGPGGGTAGIYGRFRLWPGRDQRKVRRTPACGDLCLPGGGGDQPESLLCAAGAGGSKASV